MDQSIPTDQSSPDWRYLILYTHYLWEHAQWVHGIQSKPSCDLIKPPKILCAKEFGRGLYLLMICLNLKITIIFFSKKMYSVGGGCTKWGELVKSLVVSVVPEQLHLILLQMKLDHIHNILPQTRCPAKFAFRLLRASKLAKSAIFRIFSRFFEYNCRTINFTIKLPST